MSETKQLVEAILAYFYPVKGRIKPLQVLMELTYKLLGQLEPRKDLYLLLFQETADTKEMIKQRATAKAEMRRIEKEQLPQLKGSADLLKVPEFQAAVDMLIENETRAIPGTLVSVWSEACALASYLHNRSQRKWYSKMLPIFEEHLELLKDNLRLYFPGTM